MLQSVTAVLVVRNGSTRVQRTLESLRAQTRRPDSIVVIETESDGSVTPALASFPSAQYLTTREKLSFPAAVASALRAIEPPSGPDQWLWLLAQDTAPEPTALERLMAVGEVSPSVAVAGPKLVEWDDRSRLRGYGVAVTRLGATVPVVEDELDQGQHDDISDVLGVHEAGMLVRHAVYTAIGGLDEGLPVVDGGLDLCVRARLAGHRVVVAPDARVAIGGDGVVGPRMSQRTGAVRVSHRVRRAAELHRRLAYSPGWALVPHWLALVPLAIIRSLAWLIGKRPGAIGGELAAALQVAFGGSHVGAARRDVSRSKRVGWAVIAPLRVPPPEMRRRRMLAREAALMAAHGERREIDFFGTGGGWVLMAALAASVAVGIRLIGAQTLGGGGLLPLESSVSQLWSGIGWGWRDAGLGFVGPSDPFNAVLALLGTLTFWNPSFSLVLLWFAAMPLAALGAWLLAACFTRRGGLRAVFALAWAFAPMLFSALAAGRPSAVLLHVLLPWLVFAAVRARHSWAAAGAGALLGAGVAACAPSLIPALAVAWFVWVVVSGRAVFRTLFAPAPAVALFLPLVLAQLGAGHPLRIFADPGVPQPSTPSSTWQLLLGYPGGSVGGWQRLGELFGLPSTVVPVVLLVLFAPIALLALSALFLRPSFRAAGALLGALLGLATAIVCSHTALQVSGSHAVGLWAGPGLSLYWLGACAAALFGLAALGHRSVAPAWVAIAFAVIAVVPIALAGVLGNASVEAQASGRLPAYVSAEAASQPRIGTLVITPIGADSITAGLVHGAGDSLLDQSTVASADVGPDASDARLDGLAANLASRSGYDASADLTHFGVSFVFLRDAGSADTAEQALVNRAAVALDANPLFTRVGTTSTGTLWGTAKDIAPKPLPAHPGGWRQGAAVLLLIIVFGVFLLLSIPTGRAGLAGYGSRTTRPRTPDAPSGAVEPEELADEASADEGGAIGGDVDPATDASREPAFVGARGYDEEGEA